MTATEDGVVVATPRRAGRMMSHARSVFPGFVVAVTIASAATFISDHHGGPTLLYALLIGMAFHFLSRDPVTAPGIHLTSGPLLRLGVALLGARINAAELFGMGYRPIAIVVGGVCLTIGFGRLLSARLGLSSAQGVLSGGAVAICGASAAMAISAVLPRTPQSERDTLFTVVAVTALSTCAMIVYPLIAHALSFDDVETGILLGGSIHDVAQVVAAGHLVSEKVASVGTYVKLLRVAILAPVVLAVAWAFSDRAARSSRSRAPVPAFLVAFAAFVALNSFVALPGALSAALADASRWCLVGAIAAAGIRISLEELRHVGWRIGALVVAETLFLLIFVLVALRS
jgi:uncharacterized integral membrane protein (TIGR00698 family)